MYKLQISAFKSIPFHLVSVVQFLYVYEEWLEMIYWWSSLSALIFDWPLLNLEHYFKVLRWKLVSRLSRHWSKEVSSGEFTSYLAGH